MMNGAPIQGLKNAMPSEADAMMGMGDEMGSGGGNEQAVQLLTQIVQKVGSEPITPETQGQLAQALGEVLGMLSGGV